MGRQFLRPGLAGASATFVGVGLARFAYVPLFPVMVTAGWLDGGGAGLVGALNLVGYLIGVMSGRALARWVSVPRALDFGMGLTALSFAACGWNGGLLWLAVWRCAAGISGGVLMGLAGPAVQSAVEPARRGVAGGMVIAGVGTGIVITALAIPPLLDFGLAIAWNGLAVLMLALWAFAHPRWPRGHISGAWGSARASGAKVLVVAYGIAGAGMVPHMVYLADLVVRGHGHSFGVATLAWLLFGFGALLGTLSAGRAVDRLGGSTTIRIWLTLQAAALTLVMAPFAPLLLLGAFLGGYGGIGMTAVALGRAREIADNVSGIIWQYATASFAISQAITSLALAWLFAETGDHTSLFAVGLVCSLAALALVIRRG
jgi:predicted MFS family arabinose efflux permease